VVDESQLPSDLRSLVDGALRRRLQDDRL
jgi:hypothetical protein